ncbi:MAG: SDR family NAD(P)-dependent oxidoreductase [Spirochaetota bacterium]
MKTVDLAGRRALVIGGSGGIGAAVASVLCEAGAEVFVHAGHDRQKLDRLLSRISSDGRRPPTGILASLESLSDLTAFTAYTEVHILVVAYGPVAWEPLGSDHTTSTWERMVTMNLALPGIMAERCLPYMISEQFGRIIFFGASAGDERRPSREAPAYTAAKGGLPVLARSIARSHASSGVTCNVICPGYVDTEYMSDASRNTCIRRSPTGRLTSTEEIASLVRYICTTKVVNGATINASDGLL